MYRSNLIGAFLFCIILEGSPVLAVVHNVHPGESAIGLAVFESGPGDTILVHPGVYPLEFGSEIAHSLTIIGVGGASANEVRKCTDLCLEALFDIQPQSGPVVIDGLTMTRNHAFPLGTTAIRATGVSNLTIRDCVFFDLLGYGIKLATQGNVNVTVEGNLFLPQTAGIWVSHGGAEIRRNTFVQSGVRLGEFGPAAPVISSNILYETYIHCSLQSDPVFACNDSWQSIYDGCLNPTGMNNNFAADPLFCDLATGDYRLQPGSPCAPANSPPGCGLIGALPVCAAAGIDGSAPRHQVSLRVEPNPASVAGTDFVLSHELEGAAIEIYDSAGRLVDMLRPSSTRIRWTDAAKNPRGVYFARLSTGAATAVVKFVLVR